MDWIALKKDYPEALSMLSAWLRGKGKLYSWEKRVGKPLADLPLELLHYPLVMFFSDHDIRFSSHLALDGRLQVWLHRRTKYGVFARFAKTPPKSDHRRAWHVAFTKALREMNSVQDDEPMLSVSLSDLEIEQDDDQAGLHDAGSAECDGHR